MMVGINQFPLVGGMNILVSEELGFPFGIQAHKSLTEESNMEIQEKYLGDGVYAKFDDFGVELSTGRLTEYGELVTHRIYLELDVYAALKLYWEKIYEEK
jgi:hypothetical protein